MVDDTIVSTTRSVSLIIHGVSSLMHVETDALHYPGKELRFESTHTQFLHCKVYRRLELMIYCLIARKIPHFTQLDGLETLHSPYQFHLAPTRKLVPREASKESTPFRSPHHLVFEAKCECGTWLAAHW